MYSRSFICEGDTLTPGGGKVQPKSQLFPIMYNGKLGCFEGDPVYCDTCKSWGVTKCVPPYRPYTAPDGRQANLDGDLCICKCPTQPRLKALSDKVRMSFEAHEIAGMTGAIFWQIYAGHEIEEHEIMYEIVDAKTEQPVGGMTYKLTSDNKTLLDGQNLEGGKSTPYSIKEHPNLRFVAWIKGNAK